MNITAFCLLLTLCLHAGVGGHSQVVTITAKNEPLDKIFTEIQRQTGVGFVYKWEVLQKAKLVDLQVKQATLKETLEICFRNQPLIYSIVDNTIIVSKKGNEQTNIGTETLPIDLRGKVTDENGKGIAGATVLVKGVAKLTTTTDENGEFLLLGVSENSVIVISHISFISKEITLNGKNEIAIQLKLNVSDLNPVLINTGFQTQKANEVTGSVVVITKEQLQQRVAPDIISKLEGITNGLVFNKSASNGKNELRIRGESTIFGYNIPLVVVDNFPFPFENINDINPNDVESITILKDAAAASIWGSQAGNGVIVITTRRGRVNLPMQIELNINTTINEKPNLYYSPLISSSDFIDLETFLFNKGRYTSSLNDAEMRAVSPVVEILDQRRRGLISAADSASMINTLRNIDWRDDYLKYIYRKAATQQYQLNLRGGGDKASYYFSAGYDKSLSELIGGESSRITLNSQTSYRPFKNFDLQFGLGYSENTNKDNGISSVSNLYPYTQLVDNNGNQLPVPQHRAIWEDTIISHGFLDWKYYPLKEKGYRDNLLKSYTTRLAVSLNYTLLRGLTAQISYQYLRSSQRLKNLALPESYDIRDKINKFAILSNGNYAGTNYPKGGELFVRSSDLVGHDGRFQLNYDRSWKNHAISAIGGFQVSESRQESNSSNFYGYNDATGSFIIPNSYTSYPIYPTGNSYLPSIVPGIAGPDIRRFRSYFFNAAYTYQKKYTISASGRFDGSNIFGVNINDKITPLWSVGGKWDISAEKFYKSKLFPQLSLRSSFGYNGNVSPDMVAVTTIMYKGNDLITGLPFAAIQNNPNPQLRWEKIGQYNIGIAFASTRNRITGTIEYFKKIGKDLIGDAPVDPTTGIISLRGNFSDMKSTGWDIQINSLNINRSLKWNTLFIFNYAAEKVTRYELPGNANSYKSAYLGSIKPLVGYPLRSLFSYRWGGLDPSTGDPMIYLSDTLNKNYTSSGIQAIKISDLIYNGRYNPPFFGSLTNSFSWKGVSLSFNIIYKLGHHFRRSSISYSSLINNLDWKKGYSDFHNRWQKPGDEMYTNVPSLTYPVASNFRDNFYTDADLLVEKADHARLQFINLSYNFEGSLIRKLKIRDLAVYFYANNLNIIIWRANKYGIDPEYPYLESRPTRSYSLGVRASF